MSYAIYKVVPLHEREESQKSLDLPGAILITSSLILQVLAFSQAPHWGWLSLNTIGILAAAVVLLVGFLHNERIARHPLMPLSILRIRNVVGANLMMAPVYACMLGTFFITTLYIQTVLHYSPVRTGFSYLPFPIILALMSTQIPKLVARFGFKPFLVLGPTFIAIGLALLSRMPVHGSYLANLLPTFIIMPLGVGMTFMPVITAATSGVPPSESGLASGLITTSQQMGGALGLSILSSIAASIAASSTHLGTVGSLVHGYDRAILTGVIFMAYAVALALFVIKQPRRG